jgi:hypothetical protein
LHYDEAREWLARNGQSVAATSSPESGLRDKIARAICEARPPEPPDDLPFHVDDECRALADRVLAVLSPRSHPVTDDERMIDRREAAELAAQAVAAVERPLREARAAIAARLRHEREAQPWEDDGWGTGYQEGLAFALDAIDDAINNNTEAAE